MFSEMEQIGHRLAEARAELKEASLQAKQAARRLSAVGVPDARIARDLGVSKVTIRSWLGK